MAAHRTAKGALGTCDDEEAVEEARLSAEFFSLFHDDAAPWTFPRGSGGFNVRLLGGEEGSACLAKSGVLVVVFSSVDHFEFGKTFRSRLEADPRGQLHVLQVSDQRQAWFHRAPEPDVLDPDPFGAIISLVAREARQLGVRPTRLATLGFCCGGYAAIRVGVALGAARILAFSPQAYIHLDERRERRIAPSYFDHVLESFRDAKNCPLDSLVTVLRNAAPQLRSRNSATGLELHLGEDAAEDVHEIQTFLDELRELDLQVAQSLSISVHTHRGCGHAVPYFLRNEGSLQDLLQRRLLCVDSDFAGA